MHDVNSPRMTALRAAAIGVAVVFALASGASSAAAQTADGEALYRQHCRSCHGARGTPPQPMTVLYSGLKSLADSAFLAGRSEDSLVNVMRNGIGEMKTFKEKLTREEMVAVAKFVKTLAAKTP